MSATTVLHQKHAYLARVEMGKFARSEWTFVGAPCAEIGALVAACAAALSDDWNVAYLDEQHLDSAVGTHHAKPIISNWRRREKWVSETEPTRAAFNDVDVLLINGNHFAATRQMVLLDPRKFDSLARKKATALNDVRLWIRVTDNQVIPDFLQAIVPHWATIPCLDLSDSHGIAQWLIQQQRVAPLKGLVLAGGHSVRMGEDKGALAYHHQQPQREYLADLLHNAGIETWISLRAEQVPSLPAPYVPLVDTFSDLGPMGAILSAFRADPNAAWCVVACDLPFLDASTLQLLLQQRRASAMATAFRQPDGVFPEPLVTIYEPKAYVHLLQMMAQGVSCPRKVLIQGDTQVLALPEAAKILFNVNTPSERNEANEFGIER